VIAGVVHDSLIQGCVVHESLIHEGAQGAGDKGGEGDGGFEGGGEFRGGEGEKVAAAELLQGQMASMQMMLEGIHMNTYTPHTHTLTM
jgi:hypothetical protein